MSQMTPNQVSKVTALVAVCKILKILGIWVFELFFFVNFFHDGFQHLACVYSTQTEVNDANIHSESVCG